ncbi:hypothetical protein SI65_00506 [Aspergillus cristatus]|uniref:Tetrapyrrole biosynthesis uroporphyrinogen III synthase domain-containing protein n=1 Tax=Aspergillus cristatus TaxID=573508 RepID=A0A1E3BPV8_ASPCR|nr:hypothetical protein SI65_00506 [Aspergillus cristatus]
MTHKTPTLLLKTKSTPSDAYDEYFTNKNYNPLFIPVLSHQFHAANLAHIRDLFNTGALKHDNPERKYGGLIFTSQRAVEGFARMIEEDADEQIASDSSKSLPLYTVGPATSRSLSSLVTSHLPHATIHGTDTGNGENLARFILEHYNNLAGNKNGRGEKLPLLFLVGEQRRDIIPKTLMSGELPEGERIGVEEVVVYETCVMESFEGDFTKVIDSYKSEDYDGGGEKVMWVVIFSPTGCDAMLRVLGLDSSSNDNGNGVLVAPGKRVFVATIGPTTRDHLRLKYGFEPHVCAEKPSQEGIGGGIERFMEGRNGK